MILTLRERAAALLPELVALLRLGEWRVEVHPEPPAEENQRSSVEIDRNIRTALVRLRDDTPPSQLRRQLAHELLHVRLAGLVDAWQQALAEVGAGQRQILTTWWDREEEAAIEALVDALVRERRAEWYGSPEWVSGLPTDEAQREARGAPPADEVRM